MFINENITAILESMNAKRNRINELEAICRKRWTPENYSNIEEKKAAWKKIKDETEHAANELQILNIELKIMHDNARREIYNACLPVILDILKKYNNKPYGEKTKDKISNEMKARTNCALYLRNKYDFGVIDLVPLNADGCTWHNFKYDDFDIYVKHNQNGEQKPLLKDNKINGELTSNDLYLSYCSSIVPDPHAHAEKIISEFNALKDKYSEFEKAIGAFNNLLPSQIERRNTRDFKNYL